MGLNSDAHNVFRNVNRELSTEDIRMMNPISLAFIGDAVYELFVRTKIANGKLNSNKLHRNCSKIVRASAQSKFLEHIYEYLTDEEKSVIRRGRNAQSHTVPKNANLSDYRNATALESLFGYLYLLGRDNRLKDLISKLIIEDY
ncbi:MAG: ribonuclease III domain-containing protein [Tissierellia bacterium]|nr:ribonuclease III domain-containing protein [Tissierellia bacterium]